MIWPLRKIISGGQTGADLGGLVAGYLLQYETGGMAPKNYRTENGSDPALKEKYCLTESASRAYTPRTWWNVVNSDGTVIFTYDRALDGGSLYTAQLAEGNKKPHKINPSGLDLRAWVIACNIHVLNVAGNRESKAPGIQAWVTRLLCTSLRRP